jgi:hypothetical protein
MFHREPTEKRATGAALTGLAVLLVALVSVSCGGGGNKADQAKSDVCSARADTSSQLNDLKSMSAGTVTLDAVRSDVNAIKADLEKIKKATPELASDTKQQVQQATSTFTAQLQTVAGNLLTSVSLSDAKTQLK